MNVNAETLRELLGLISVVALGVGVGMQYTPWFGVIAFGAALYFVWLVGALVGRHRRGG